jgi:hypothetical protein
MEAPMPARLNLLFSCLLLAGVGVGCDADSPFSLLFSGPDCTISDLRRLDASPGNFAKSMFIVSNTGDGATAFNIGLQVTLKTGNLIVDRTGIGVGDLNSGESIVAEVWFSSINSHSEYDRAEYYLWWYDAEGTYYDKQFINP